MPPIILNLDEINANLYDQFIRSLRESSMESQNYHVGILPRYNSQWDNVIFEFESKRVGLIILRHNFYFKGIYRVDENVYGERKLFQKFNENLGYDVEANVSYSELGYDNFKLEQFIGDHNTLKGAFYPLYQLSVSESSLRLRNFDAKTKKACVTTILFLCEASRSRCMMDHFTFNMGYQPIAVKGDDVVNVIHYWGHLCDDYHELSEEKKGTYGDIELEHLRLVLAPRQNLNIESKFRKAMKLETRKEKKIWKRAEQNIGPKGDSKGGKGKGKGHVAGGKGKRHVASQHWTPLPTKVPMEINENEEEDDMLMAGLAEFAVPLLPRKRKKNLDFSKWKELQSENTTSTTVNNSNGSAKKSSKIMSPKHMFDSWPTAMDISRETSLALPTVDDVMEEEDSYVEDPAFQAAKYPIVNSSNSLKQEAMSIESQIHEENCARLNNMSDNEIVEAQAELMQKMKPGLLEKLKKRGQTKLDQTKSSTPTTSVSESHLQGGSQSTPLVDVKEHVTQVLPSKGILLSGGTEPVRSKNDMWISWSERVEAARNLRFSFDGNIIVEDKSVVTSNNGAIPDCSQHNDGNVGERDYLRTEGDPSAAGYTIREAVALSRSMIPGQRAFALSLLASLLGKALQNLHHSQDDCNLSNASSRDKPVDWKAVWAYALGPEPELALLLRLTLDDNYFAVVSASLKAIQCVLSCEMNERFFDLSAKLATNEKIVYTAPVFQSKLEISNGYLHGGYWKYNTKPSNMLPSFGEDEMVDDDENEEKHTIKDDINVASQDFARGLVRMGILPKIQFQLEEDCSSDIEELLISILIRLVRHSPKCASAIIEYPRLVQLIVDRFVKKDTMKVRPSKIKAVTLIKVLAQSDKKVCAEFIEKGIFRTLTWHLSQYPLTLEDWMHLGKMSRMLKSALIVEQLRLWKVCIQYGYCVSSFRIIFPGLYMWLSPPVFDKLIENDVLSEFTSITRELYLVMESLAKRLPYLSKFFDLLEGTDSVKNSADLLWVISAVIHMLSTVTAKVALKNCNGSCKNDGCVPWLPELVPKIGLEIIKNKFLDFSGANSMDFGRKSLIKLLDKLRHNKDLELSLSSACCLQGLIQLIVALDNSIQTAKIEIQTTFSQRSSFSVECEIPEDGIVTRSRDELKCLLNSFMKSISYGWRDLQFIETFGRGGPAPRVGDELYGRQFAVYLHHSVELSVRVSSWNTLSNAHILELLPPLEKCLGAAEGYLETEDNEEVLEAHIKSWTAGALDRAAVRGSMSFTLALHHLSCFFFHNKVDDKSILRMKLTKSLLRNYSRKEQHKHMLMELIRYTKQETCAGSVRKEAALLQPSEIERRFRLLEEACQGERSLLEKVEKLKSDNR